MAADNHMHACKGDGEKPCPTAARIGPCKGALFHLERCIFCSDRATNRVLFGTPVVDLGATNG